MNNSNNEEPSDAVATGEQGQETVHRKEGKHIFKELIIPVIVMSMSGVFYWAIRGTGGYGGSSGGGFAGIGWAMCWYFLAHERGEVKRRNYSMGWMVLAIFIGMWFGGLHGWGQFNSWIKGIFGIGINNSATTSINPAWGWAAHFQCGMVWTGVTGIFMAWCGSRKKVRGIHWLGRIGFGFLGAFGAVGIFYAFPSLTLPLYSEGYYSAMPCGDCDLGRTFSTALSSMIYFGIFAGLMAYEMVRKDWRNVFLALLMALGGGLSQMVSALWFFGDILPTTIYSAWWKAWEMSTGFGHGITLGVCYYLFNRPSKDRVLTEKRKQPFSVHRNSEKDLGVNFPIVFGLGLAIRGGLQGLGNSLKIGELFGFTVANGFTVGQIAVFTTTIVDAISILIIMILVVVLILNFLKSQRNPSLVLDGKTNIRYPGVRFIIVQLVLVITGYAAATSHPPLDDNNIILLVIYTLVLLISMSFMIARWIIVSKERKDNAGLEIFMKEALEERKQKSRAIKIKSWIDARPTNF